MGGVIIAMHCKKKKCNFSLMNNRNSAITPLRNMRQMLELAALHVPAKMLLPLLGGAWGDKSYIMWS